MAGNTEMETEMFRDPREESVREPGCSSGWKLLRVLASTLLLASCPDLGKS